MVREVLAEALPIPPHKGHAEVTDVARNGRPDLSVWTFRLGEQEAWKQLQHEGSS